MNQNSSRQMVPEAKPGLDNLKFEIARELGVNLKQGYNGDLTSRKAGSVGGQMVKKMCPVRSARFDRHNRIAPGHVQTVQYIAAVSI